MHKTDISIFSGEKERESSGFNNNYNSTRLLAMGLLMFKHHVH